jgi:hypothetical protein
MSRTLSPSIALALRVRTGDDLRTKASVAEISRVEARVAPPGLRAGRFFLRAPRGLAGAPNEGGARLSP